jgi:hypothetical protein
MIRRRSGPLAEADGPDAGTFVTCGTGPNGGRPAGGTFRYSTGHDSRSLFYSTDVATLQETYPEIPALRPVSDGTRLVVSEPIGDLRGLWNTVPESSYGVIHAGQDEMYAFRPVSPN